jgi:outer membrane protein assembly factor BamB
MGAGSAFGEWNDDQGASAASLWSRLGAAPVARGADVAVGVSGGKMIGVPLDGSPRWTVSNAIDSRPVLAAGVVVASGGGSLFAVDAKTGQKLWTLEAPGALRGAGDDGSLTAVTLGLDHGSALLLVDRDGRLVRRIETDKTLGVPAVVAGVALVPWGTQYVSAVDAASGDEIGRILVREKTSRAWVNGGHVYFGETGIFRFDEKTRFASVNRASHVALPPRELPGSPVLFTAPELKTPLIAGARDRIRLYAQPADVGGMLGLSGGRYYATYFRIAMGFDGGRGQLAWVKTLGSDVIGGAAGDASVALCAADGKVSLFDGRTGGVARELEMGEPVQACVVQLDGLRVTGTPAPPLSEQLAASLVHEDADLATAQRLLLRELAALEDEVATKVLVDLLLDPKTPVPVAADARTALAGRRNGARFMIAALAQHYDFLKDVLVPPPSGPIAQALAQIKDPASPGPLASHLLDPATPDPDLRSVAAALAVVAREPELPSLQRFFAMYQGTAASEDVESAVVSTGQGILRLGGKDGRELVERAAAKPTSSETLRAKLKALLESASTKK